MDNKDFYIREGYSIMPINFRVNEIIIVRGNKETFGASECSTEVIEC